MFKVERIFVDAPYAGNANIKIRQPIDTAAWIWHPELRGDDAAFVLFRKEFVSDGSPLVIHVSADECYELSLDGQRISRGPHRGDLNHWAYSSYEIELPPGRHEFTALAWVMLQVAAPFAQLSWRGGFILKAEDNYDKLLSTGTAEWLVARAKGWKARTEKAHGVLGVGAAFEWNGGAVASETERPAEVIRQPVVSTLYGEPVAGWALEPSSLPDMLASEKSVGIPLATGKGRPDNAFRFHRCVSSEAWGVFSAEKGQ